MLNSRGVENGGPKVIYANSPRKDGSDRRVRIYSPEYQERGFIVAGHQPVVILTHWIERRTVPCTGPDCPGHRQGQKPRPKGYLACYYATSGFPVLVEISEFAWQKLDETLAERGSLRGLMLYTSRLHQARNAPVLIRTNEPSKGQPIPPDFDLIPHLARLFGVPISLFREDESVDDSSSNGDMVPLP